MDLNNGIRVMLPNLCVDDWQDQAPSQRDGEIPIFISLLEPPNEATTVYLEAISQPVSLSTNTLHFTPENWDQSQIVWANLNEVNSEEAITTLEIAANLQISNDLAKSHVEIFSISLPSEYKLALGGCTTESDNTSQSDQENPNIDLELSTVREEESPAFLLLRAALSPLILLTNMAMHSIQQIKGARINQLKRAELKNQPSNENPLIENVPREASQTDLDFEGLDLIPQSIDQGLHLNKAPTLPITPSISCLSDSQQQNTADFW